jgi:tetratricopeptide (TPR) repeat protein
MRRARWGGAGLALLLVATDAEAQRPSDLTAGVTRIIARRDGGAVNESASDSVARSASHRIRAVLDRVPPQAAPLASLLVPGLGQARLRQGRAAAYLAVEAFLLLQYSKDLSEAHRNERDYREIARTIARRGFVASPPDTAFQYYEKLGKYIESGAYSLTTSGPVVPETDASTYNGAQWDLARRQFGVTLDPGEVGGPAYERALAMYEELAVQQPYRWSWRNAQLEKDIYSRTIARANDAYRRATLEISAVIANHLLSAVDAFTVVRLSQLPGGSMRLSASIPVR